MVSQRNLHAADTLVTISVTVWLYFARFESSGARATPGKLFRRLRVERAGVGGVISFSAALLRTVIKLLPWEIAHLTNNLPEPIWYAPEPSFRRGFIGVAILIGSYMVMVLVHPKKQAPHDLLAGTVVVKRNGRGAP